MSEHKKITLHPLREDGSIDTDTNLYPKTSSDQIVDDEGNPVEVATRDEIPTEISDLDNDVGYITEDSLTDYATKTELSEKANDNEVVKLTGNQTIQGNKSFSGDIDINDVTWGSMRAEFSDGDGGYHYLYYYSDDMGGPAFDRLGIWRANIESLSAFSAEVYDVEEDRYLPVATQNFVENYVNENTGTKLYFHRFKLSRDAGSDVYLLLITAGKISPDYAGYAHTYSSWRIIADAGRNYLDGETAGDRSRVISIYSYDQNENVVPASISGTSSEQYVRWIDATVAGQIDGYSINIQDAGRPVTGDTRINLAL